MEDCAALENTVKRAYKAVGDGALACMYAYKAVGNDEQACMRAYKAARDEEQPGMCACKAASGGEQGCMRTQRQSLYAYDGKGKEYPNSSGHYSILNGIHSCIPYPLPFRKPLFLR